MNEVDAQETAHKLEGGGRIADAAYGIYAWTSLVVCVSAAIIFALVTPGLERRRRLVSAAARAWLFIAGMRIRVTGKSNIPEGHCIVVANHASYLDGLILQAVLPPRFSFVIKGEMQKVPLAHFLLRRIGSRFVDRFVASASLRTSGRSPLSAA